MFRAYLRLVCFAFGLLIGVQVPSLIDQYAKRVDAHRIEADKNFSGFRLIAEQMFHGNVDALIAHHRLSGDPVFKREAGTIEANYSRLQMLEQEWQALQGSLVHKLLHVALKPNRELLKETLDAYSYTVPLNAAAILCGLLAALLASLLVELLWLGTGRVAQRVVAGRPRHQPVRVPRVAPAKK